MNCSVRRRRCKGCAIGRGSKHRAVRRVASVRCVLSDRVGLFNSAARVANTSFVRTYLEFQKISFEQRIGGTKKLKKYSSEWGGCGKSILWWLWGTVWKLSWLRSGRRRLLSETIGRLGILADWGAADLRSLQVSIGVQPTKKKQYRVRIQHSYQHLVKK